jgi:hypothetical protein
MANTFDLIQAYELLVDTANGVTFSAIPQTYTDLLIRFSVRSGRTGQYSDDLRVTLNSSTNYTNIRLYGLNDTTNQDGGTGSTNNYLGVGTAVDADGSAFSSGQYLISNYTNASYPKAMNSYAVASNNVNNSYQSIIGNMTNVADNAPITSINIKGYNAPSGTLLAKSSIRLYGLKNS